jgi:RNA polymerase sigma factor (sigma-70 family)
LTASDLVALHVGVIARDPDALAEFEQRLRPLVLGWLRSKGVQDADAGEIWNEAFLAVIDRAAQLGPLGASLRPFTMTVAHNLWVSRVRKATRLDEVALEAAADAASADAGQAGVTSLSPAQLAHLERCLESARPAYRDVVEFAARGLATDEIAKIVQKTKANVQKLRQRGCAWLRSCLKGILDV